MVNNCDKYLFFTQSDTMGLYQLKRIQRIPATLKETWTFFSAPANLPKIIPPDLQFTVLSDSGTETMYAGQIISYQLKPILNLSYHWVTEITHVEHEHYFVDEQRFGPYAFWHHAHFFSPIDGGTEMTDLVHYKIPFWQLGNLAHTLFVKKKLENIFDYRNKVVSKTFGDWV